MDDDLLTPPVYKALKQYSPEWSACFDAVFSTIRNTPTPNLREILCEMREVLPLYDCESKAFKGQLGQLFGDLHFHTESGYVAFCLRFF